MSASYQKYLKYKQQYLNLMSNDKGRLRDYSNINSLNYLKSSNISQKDELDSAPKNFGILNNETLHKSFNRLSNLNNNLYDTKKLSNVYNMQGENYNNNLYDTKKLSNVYNMQGGDYNKYLSSVTSDNFMTEINEKINKFKYN